MAPTAGNFGGNVITALTLDSQGRMGLGADPEHKAHIRTDLEGALDIRLHGQSEGAARVFVGKNSLDGGGFGYEGTGLSSSVPYMLTPVIYRMSGGSPQSVLSYSSDIGKLRIS